MIKKGFSIEIDVSLTEEEDRVARELADYFIEIAGPDLSWAHSDSRTFRTGGGRASVTKRGILGLLFGPKEAHQVWVLVGNSLVFRRSSRKRRIFTISRPDILERIDGEPLSLELCHCGRCPTSQQRVRYKQRPETYIYYTVGDIKG